MSIQSRIANRIDDYIGAADVDLDWSLLVARLKAGDGVIARQLFLARLHDAVNAGLVMRREIEEDQTADAHAEGRYGND